MLDSLTLVKTDLGKIATGAAMALGGAVLGNGLTYLYGLVIGRSLGPEGVGFYFLALAFMQFIGAVCRVGLPEGLLRFVAIYGGRADWSRVKGTILSAVSVDLGTSVLAATLLFLSAEFLSVRLFRQPELALYVRWLAVTLPFFSLSTLIANATQALKRIDLVVLSRDVCQPVIMFLLAMVLLYAMRGPVVFLAAYWGSMVFALVASVALLGRACPTLARTASVVFEWKRLLAFSVPIVGSDLAYYLLRWTDTLLLSVLRSPTEVGIYSAALRTTLLLNLLAVSANALYAPIIADHHHQGRHQELQAILKTLLRWCLTLALPIVLGLIVLSGDILILWGREFVIGSSALVVLAVSQLILALTNILAFTLLMSGKQYVELGNTVFVTVVSIVMNLALIPRNGITGAATAMLISQVTAFVIRLVEVRRFLGIRLYTPKYVKPLAASTIVSLLAFWIQNPLVTTVSSVFPGSRIGAMAVTLFLVAVGYLMILYFLGFEQEDLIVWRGFRRLDSQL